VSGGLISPTWDHAGQSRLAGLGCSAMAASLVGPCSKARCPGFQPFRKLAGLYQMVRLTTAVGPIPVLRYSTSVGVKSSAMAAIGP
jgi:hypothetical protein